jgi:SulP family sulfate permease
MLLASSCLALILLWPKRLNRYLPAPFVALVAAALVVRVGGFEVVTIGSKFGGIPQGLPTFTPLVADWHRFGELLSPAFKIAILGAIESLLAAVVADRALRDQHDANQELMAQGLANVVAPLFGGMAATGAVARTATNIQNGGRTPVAGIVHALFVLGVIVIAAPLAAYVPLAALSAILISVAIKMGDWDIRKAWHFPWRDTFILATTFALTVLFDLTVAIEIGLMIAAGFFIQRMAAQTRVHRLVQDDAVLFERHAIWGKTLPPATLLYRVEGALFFGAVDKLKQVVECAEREAARVVIVQLHRTVLMDTSGLLALAELHDRLAAQGRTLVLASVPEPLLRKVRESGLAAQLGEDNLQPDLYAAFARAAVLSAQSAL